MNYASPEKLSQLATPDHRLERSLRTKIAALKEKLDNFTAVDAHGKPVGDIRNLVINQRQLCLIIVQPDIHRHWRFVLLASHLVQRISLRDRVVFVHTTQADISYLPEHQAKTLTIETSSAISAQTTLTASISQLPAPLAIDRPHRLEPANRTASSGWLGAQDKPQLPDSSKQPQLVEAPATPKMLAAVVGTFAPSSSSKHSVNVTQAVRL
jgi:hypothetical protein